MTYIQWMSLTENEYKFQRKRPQPDSPGERLVDVDEALLAYQSHRSKANLKKLRDVIQEWTNSAAYEQMVDDKARKTIVKPALKEMGEWLEAEHAKLKRQEYQDVLVEFSMAAQSLLTKFPMMPDLYKKALQDTFVCPSSGPGPLYCMKYYKDQSKWDARLKDLGDKSPAAFSTSVALTATWEMGNPKCVTEHAQWSEPYNRGIEFVKVSRDSFTHELLHWSTNEAYKRYVESTFTHRSPEYNFFKEAVTEFLKRQATGNLGAGGYPDEYKEAVEVTKIAGLNEYGVAEAYLLGNNIPKTVDLLLQARKQHEAAQAMFMSPGERETFQRILTFFAEKTTFPSQRDPKKMNPETRAVMFKGFREDRLTADQVKAKMNLAWSAAWAEELKVKPL
jgi:hypothetical protein